MTCHTCGAPARQVLTSGYLYAICTVNPDHEEEIDRYGD